MEGVTGYAGVRFMSALVFAIAGTTLAVGAFVFSAGTERWLGLGVGAGALAILLTASAVGGRGLPQRVLDAVLAPICAWAIVSSRTIELSIHGSGPDAVRWLSFASGAAIAGVGLLSLILHELALERDLAWAAGRISTLHGEETAVQIHDFRDTTERDQDAFPRTSG